MKALSFASLAYENKKKKTRREKFLEEMDKVIPWKELKEVIRPYYPKAGNGRQPMPLEMMLRIYFMQQWYGLSDPAMESLSLGRKVSRTHRSLKLTTLGVPGAFVYIGLM